MAEEEKKVLRPAPRASSHAVFHTHSRVTPVAVGRRCGDGRSVEHRAPIRNQEVERRLHVRVGLARRARARGMLAHLSGAQRTWPARVDRSRDSKSFFPFARPMGNSQVELGYLRRHVRHLPQLAERAVHRVPSEPVAQQRERPLDRVRLLRTCVSSLSSRAPAVALTSVSRGPRPSPTHADVFHLDCIQRWLKTRSVCPLCNKEWEFAKIERIPGYGSLS